MSSGEVFVGVLIAIAIGAALGAAYRVRTGRFFLVATTHKRIMNMSGRCEGPTIRATFGF
jgi:hypothetical protein